jgi:DNA-binding CsgD family transcriptional regulator/rhodanese-related sulfurtransferase
MDFSAIPERARQHLTKRQEEILDLLADGKPVRQVAKEMQLEVRAAWYLKARAVKALAAAGYTDTFDASRFVDPGQQIKGKSTYTRDDEGNPVWIKTDATAEAKHNALRDFVEGLKHEILPAAPTPTPDGIEHDPELMSAIVIGDAHLGCRAFSKETRGHDFDTDIATRDIRAAVDNLIARAPNAETGVLVDVGDFTHSDSSHNKTFAGTDVDVDTRHYKVKRAAGMVIRYCVDQMLKKYKKVIVVIAKGNHNPNAAEAVQLMVEFYYEREPRVNVLKTQSYFHYIEFGRWLIGVNHGDKVKAQKLVSVMARDMAQAWGRTTHRMWMLGHVHHEKMMEFDGCKVKTFGTLAPPDGWHASMGFASESTMEMITFKKQGGTHSVLVYDIPALITEPDVTI